MILIKQGSRKIKASIALGTAFVEDKRQPLRELLMKSFLLPIAIVSAWMLLIVGLSTSIGDWHHSQNIIMTVLAQIYPAVEQRLSSAQLDTLNFWARKGAHFSEYAVLFSLAYWACRRYFNLIPKIALPVVLVSVILFAISDEFHQSFVPGRSPQIRDVLIDSLGASTVALLCLKFDAPAFSDTSSSHQDPQSP